jgi:hypothetical protein
MYYVVRTGNILAAMLALSKYFYKFLNHRVQISDPSNDTVGNLS